jgi:hypothetical protein
MPKPICVPCQRFYRPKKTGVYFTEQMPRAGTDRAPPGNSAPHMWRPYKLWSGDLWECQGCGSRIVVGTGSQPVRESHQKDFEEERQRLGATRILVNDC